jgi:hypothetical protein
MLTLSFFSDMMILVQKIEHTLKGE